jgi:penicillin-binding protein 2
MTPALRQLQKQFGLSFTDNFRSPSPKLSLTNSSPSSNTRSPVWMWLIMILGFGIIVARLFYLQIIQGRHFWEMSNGNRIRLINLPAPRGIIYDRRHQPLVRNTPLFQAKITHPDGQIEIRSLSRDEALNYDVKGPSALDLPDDYQIDFLQATGRESLVGPAAAHLLGYLGEVSAEELPPTITTHPPSDCQPPQPCCSTPKLGELVGRGGIEQQSDCWLRGQSGSQLLEVDTLGRLTRQLGNQPPVPGNNLTLTIDLPLQQAAYDALTDRPGAVVATNPNTGEILALVSSPSFDSNIFNPQSPDLQSNSSDQITQILNDPARPLFNRATAGAYEPGSTFKIVTAAAGLETVTITPDWLYTDTGVETLGTYTYTNWYYTQYGATEGQINVSRALARSTDTFFYKLGGMIGVHDLTAYARKFGLGQPTGIDLPGEASGLVPDPAWKLQVKGERWYLGNTYHLAIGQADLLATPLQVNQVISAIASGGQWCRPHVIDYSASDYPPPEDSICHDLELNSDYLAVIAQGLHGVCSTGGTAYPLFDFPVSLACKTGTAQTVGDATHAWLTVYAPYVDPRHSQPGHSELNNHSEATTNSSSPAVAEESLSNNPANLPPIALTVLLERGGEGSADAAPVAQKILETWYNN